MQNASGVEPCYKKSDMGCGFILKHARALTVVVVAALLAIVSGLLLRFNAPLVRLSYDETFPLDFSPPTITNSPVVLVYLDLVSYLREKQNPDEPWNRALHARLLRRLTEARAKAVVFDIIFDQPGKDAEADTAFADAMRANGRVVLGAELDFSTRSMPGELSPRTTSQVLPLQRFREAAAAWGIAKFAVDMDFMVRQLFIGRLSQEQPSLTWATAKLIDLPITRAGAPKEVRRWVRYYGLPLTIPHVSHSDALEPAAVNDDFFRDKIVFIGARPIAGSLRERKDEFRSPFSSWGARDQFMPAVEVHATQLLNLVRGDWLRRLPAAAESWLLILLAVALPAVLIHFRPLSAAGIALVASAALLAIVSWAFTAQRLWFPWLIVGAVQIPGALLGSILFHFLEWYRTRRRLEALRRQAEQKIREQAALIDKAQDAILVQDLQGRVDYVNPSAERLYGWSLAELQADGAVQQLFAPSAGKLTDARRAVMEKGEWLGELDQATRTGQQLVVASRWTLIRDEAGQPKSLLLINTDITEKKRLEAQFLRTQRIETIGALAGGMAHDLNNALSPILMGIQLIGRKNQDDDTQRMLAVMEASTHRGAEMVRQVLTFSRGHEGGSELLNVGRLVHEMEAIVRQTLPKSIKVVAMVPPDLWPVLGNSTELHQVLLNLCVNARDAMPRGGELTLAADNVELRVEDTTDLPNAVPGKYVMLLVSDTGTGIAPDALPHIFEPFFTTKTPDKGTGLGLATIARIVRNHGGFVGVKSEPGAGTTFEIYFPRAESPVAPATADVISELPRGQGELILLIEDDHSIRQMVASSLTDHGYRVALAGDGIEALTLLEKHRRDVRLVLSDLSLPSIDGASPLETIRVRRPDLPVILMSGALESAPPALKGVQFLPKPFRLDQLLSAIAEPLHSRPPAQ